MIYGRRNYKIIKSKQEGTFMGKHFFDYEDGDFAHALSGNMAIDSYGDLLMRIGDNIAMDMDSGELRFISDWSDDGDD